MMLSKTHVKVRELTHLSKCVWVCGCVDVCVCWGICVLSAWAASLSTTDNNPPSYWNSHSSIYVHNLIGERYE